MKIKFENYSLFDNSNIYELSPLTFLIGGNNCGKTTFIKGLEVIGNGMLDSFSQVKDGKSGIVAFCEILPGLNRVQTYDVMNETDFLMERSFKFTSESHKPILSVSPYMGSTEPENVVFYPLRLLEVLNNAGLKIKNERVNQLLQSKKVIKKHIKDEEIGIDRDRFQPDKEIENLERWFFQSALIKLLDISNESAEFQNEVVTVFIEVFKPYSFLGFYKSNSDIPNRIWDKERKLLSIQVIKNSDLSPAKRIYCNTDFIRKPLYWDLEEEHYTSHAEYYDSAFRTKWFKKFFGTENPLNINKFQDFFEIKLNGRHLTEQGSGITKILQYILFFSTRTANVWDEDRSILFDIDKSQEKLEREMLLIDHRKRQWPDKKRFVYIEEPEVHLHPNFQILLAEMIFELALNSTYHFIIETHSEYIIRKMQLLKANNKTSASDLISILNFGSGKNLGKVQTIQIDEFGSLSSSFFPGFFDLNQELQYQLMLTNRNNQN
jgi:predicted ATPase